MIDYKIISDSLEFYSNKGFKRIETPWTVTSAVIDITRPKDSKTVQLKHEDNKGLVASAEQGFLYQIIKGFLPPGRYQSVTPCFRGDSFDITHTKYFIKNELIITEFEDSPKNEVARLVVIASEFFKRYITAKDLIKRVQTHDGYDIEFNGVEVGSYGHRQYKHLSWVYGTGVAEPRFSNLLQEYDISYNKNTEG